jgi:hypothetical protein
MRTRTLPAIGMIAAGALALALTGCCGAASSAPTGSASASVSARAASQETHIVWTNDTGTALTLTVGDVQSGGYDGDSRPDHAYPQGINGYTLEPGDSVDERIEVNTHAVPRFTLTPSGTQTGGDSIRLVYSDDPTATEDWWSWIRDGQTDYVDKTSFRYVDAAGTSQTGTITVDFTGDNATTITFG